jgi:predicted lipoprotein
MRASIQIVVLAVLLAAMGTSAHAEADHAAIARDALKNYIRPGYEVLADRAAALAASTKALCAEPSDTKLKVARETFANTVEAWSEIEPVRFGPVLQDHRYERLFYWPDPKGLGAKQIRDALAKRDETVKQETTLAGKSVALQGLPALEYLLYGDGASDLAKPGGEGAFRCSFANAVANNVASISRQIADGWGETAPFVKAYLDPGPDNPTYHAPKEVTLDLFKTFAVGIEAVRDQKLAKMLGAKAEEAKPGLAPFGRSGLTFVTIADNLVGVRVLFLKGGFAQVVHQESAGVEDSIAFDLDHAIEVLRGIDAPIAEALRDEKDRAKLEALRVSLKSAAQTAGDMISKGAGLSFGFNAMDGD